MLALEIMHVLMENPTNDSIELAIAFLKECGQRLTDVSPRGITGLLYLMQILSNFPRSAWTVPSPCLYK